MNYALVLTELYGDKVWTLTGNTYDGLTWSDDSPKPSDATLVAQYDDAQTVQTNQEQINTLVGKLAATDYVALSDYDQDKTDVKAQRQQWRESIRTLQAEIDSLKGVA